MIAKLKKTIKYFIRRLPFMKLLLQGIKKIYMPSMEVRNKLSFIGQFDLKLNENQILKLNHYGFIIENEMFWKGLASEWEQVSLKTWIKLSRKSTVIFDIGANTGMFSLLAKSYNPKAHIYAFEPQPNINECFKKQIILNGFDIQLFSLALSNENGITHFYNYDFDADINTTAGSLNQAFRNLATQQAIEVETIRLDKFLQQQKISKIDLIKMDVESFEPQVFEGAGDAIKKLQPIILVEIQSDEIGQKVQNLLNPMIFEIYNIDEDKGLIKVDKLKEQLHKNHLIVPAIKKTLFTQCLDENL